MANQVGKRYVCRTCGAEVVITRAGGGTIECHGQDIQLRDSATIPSVGKPVDP